jgi:CTP synthase (UTP-ammonia lyase)
MITCGVVGDYDKSYINHINTDNALLHAAKMLSIPIEITWCSTENVSREELKKYNLIWCAPGSPYKSLEGALEAIRFARENNVPFMGTCGGFQHTVIEYARNVLGIKDAAHAEYDPGAEQLLITPLVCSVKGQALEVLITENSVAYRGYNNQETTTEEYHCRYGLNPEYVTLLSEGGLIVSGIDNNNEPRIIELPGNDFFISTLFLPQSLSTEARPHPLIVRLVNAADKFSRNRSGR